MGCRRQTRHLSQHQPSISYSGDRNRRCHPGREVLLACAAAYPRKYLKISQDENPENILKTNRQGPQE